MRGFTKYVRSEARTTKIIVEEFKIHMLINNYNDHLRQGFLTILSLRPPFITIKSLFLRLAFYSWQFLQSIRYRDIYIYIYTHTLIEF